MDFREALAHLAGIIDPLLAADPYPDTVRPDYLAAAVRDYPARGGKRLRPALTCWSGGVFGAPLEKLLLPAAAIEVFHNWTLVHDDIIDRDDRRRGAPTTHVAVAQAVAGRFTAADAVRSGIDFAILCGDLQQAWANDLLLRGTTSGVRPEVICACARNMQYLGGQLLISGEAVDVEMSFRDPASVTPDEVRRMIAGKTGALLRLAAETGAMIALDTPDRMHPAVQKLGDFAQLCGLAFQLRDDYLGIFGDARLGKPLGNDLREAKPTLLLITAFRRLDEAGCRELRSLLKRPETDGTVLDRAREIFTACGAAAAIETEMNQAAEQAASQLTDLPDNEYRQWLHDFAAATVSRQL